MSVALSIVFTGLCALVTDGDRGPAQVLLVDARGVGEVGGGVVLPPHAPTLVASLRSLANADTSSPSRVVVAAPVSGGGRAADGRVDQIGIWDLAGSEVRIRVAGGEPPGLRVFRPAPGSSSWPAPPRDADDPGAWSDIRFLPHMSALAGDGRVDPSLVEPHDDGGLPSALAARVHLDAGRVEAGLPTLPDFRRRLFEFRAARGEPKARHAVTDTIRWSLDDVAGPVVVEIVPVRGGPVKRLVFAAGAEAHTVFVSNLPGDDDAHRAHAASADQAAAHHFGAYYRLLRHAPEDAPAPHVVPVDDERGTGLAGTRFCPPVWFSR